MSNNYREIVLKTVKIHKDDQMECSAMGLVVESAAFLDFVKKNLIHHQPLDKENMKKQLGRIRWFMELAAINLGMSMEEIEKLSEGSLKMQFFEKFAESIPSETEENEDHDDCS